MQVASAIVLTGLLLTGPSSAQYHSGDAVIENPPRPTDAYTYVQPKNTTILGQYGHSPPVYPSPNATGVGSWEDALVKAKAFVAQLTLDEKADMVTGQPGPCVGNIVAIPRLDFPGLCIQDGPLALRFADYVSVFPAGVTVAASWDKDLMYERGYALGQEFKAKGAHVILGPVAGPLGRSAYGGRNWEGFSPDPYLTGIAMEKTIHGHQDAGVQACAKHFVGNEQEIQRNPALRINGSVTDIVQESLSSNIDDRTLHELYMWPFANAARAKAASFMCIYNRFNGSYGCANSKLLNGALKGELGYQGYVVSDWHATHSGLASIASGLDMDMPGGMGFDNSYIRPDEASFFGKNITKAVKNDTLDISRLDDMVIRIMTPYYWLGQDKDYPTVDSSSAALNDFSPSSSWTREFNITGESSRDARRDHAKLIRKHAAASTVLLKNEGALPLKKPGSVAVFGNAAGDPTQGYINQKDYEFGAIFSGGGSGAGRLTSRVTPLDAIKERVGHDGATLQLWLNNTFIANSNITSLWNPTPPDVCLVFLKAWAEEAADRNYLKADWDGDAVVESVARDCNNTIVVTYSAGINVLPWADHPNITAILLAHFPGEQAGNSLIDILYGDVNPSAKLPYTIAFKETDYHYAPLVTDVNTAGADDWQSNFEEKLEIDYRYFDSHNISTRYEFGYGLSYTTFELADIQISSVDNISPRSAPQPIVPGGNPDLWNVISTITANVSNTGAVDGTAIPQLYISFPDSVPKGTPPKQLRGFEKVHLAAGGTKSVTFELMRRDLSYWDIIAQDWVVPEGEFTFSVGFSSRDLQLSSQASVLAQ